MATKAEKSYVGQSRIHAVEEQEGRYAVPGNSQHDLLQALQALLVRAQLEVLIRNRDQDQKHRTAVVVVDVVCVVVVVVVASHSHYEPF